MKFGIIQNFTILLFVFLSFSTWHAETLAQSTVKIRGTVQSVDGMPLEGANVIIVGTGVGTAADNLGYFEIENLFAGEYTLQASYIGFKTKLKENIIVFKDMAVTVNFTLKPKVIQMEQIAVEAERDDADNYDSFITISAERIRNSSAKNAGELLRDMPGVEIVDTDGNGQQKISIRGSFNNQVLVVVDGVELNDPFTGEANLKQIPVTTIEQINIWKKGSSNRFGSGAIGGVIEIISKKHPLDKVQLSSYAGSFGSFGFQSTLSGHYGNFGYFVNFESAKSDGNFQYSYQDLAGKLHGSTRENADFSSENYFGKLFFEKQGHSVQIQYNHFQSSRGLPGLVFQWTPYAHAVNSRRILVAKYGLQGNLGKTNLQFSHSDNATEYENFPPDGVISSVPAYHTKYRVQKYSTTLDFQRKLFGQHKLYLDGGVAHTKFEEDDFISPVIFAAPIEVKNLSRNAAASIDWNLPRPIFLNKLQLSSSIRYDHISFEHSETTRQDEAFSPQLGLHLSAGQKCLFNFHASWGRSFRSPTFADLFYQDFRVHGNPNLPPEKSKNIDAGVKFSAPILGWLEFETNYFSNDFKNLIYWELGSFGDYQPYSTDASIQGWEFNSRWTLFDDHIQLNGSHLILCAKNKSHERTRHNKKLTYRPSHTTKLSLRFNYSNLNFEYQRRLVGERFLDAANNKKVASYSVDDVTIGMDFIIKKIDVDLKISLFNLFDENYTIITRAPLPSRNWRIGLGLSF